MWAEDAGCEHSRLTQAERTEIGNNCSRESRSERRRATLRERVLQLRSGRRRPERSRAITVRAESGESDGSCEGKKAPS